MATPASERPSLEWTLRNSERCVRKTKRKRTSRGGREPGVPFKRRDKSSTLGTGEMQSTVQLSMTIRMRGSSATVCSMQCPRITISRCATPRPREASPKLLPSMERQSHRLRRSSIETQGVTSRSQETCLKGLL